MSRFVHHLRQRAILRILPSTAYKQTKMDVTSKRPCLEPGTVGGSNAPYSTVPSDHTLPISMEDVYAARERVKDQVHYTPIMECAQFNSLTGLQLYFKCEQFQKTGSFKVRGATNAMMKVLEQRAEAGQDKPILVATSSGNHAQAVALAAKRNGLKAEIVMPSNSPASKVEAVKGYGGEVTLCEPTEEGRRKTAEDLVKSIGPQAVLIPSANHPDVMAGQGTIGLEMMEQVSDLDAIVASVSCGGLLSGVTVGAKGVNPNVKIFAAEPAVAGSCAKSLEAGKIIPNETYPDTIADALRLSVAEFPFQVIKNHVSGVVMVTDREMLDAMKLVWERMKVIIEPAAACAVAAVLSQNGDKFRQKAGPDVKKVGVVLCGGNLDMNKMFKGYEEEVAKKEKNE